MQTLLREFFLAMRRTLCYLSLVLIFSTALAVTASAQVPPVISSFSPASGPVGTTVTVTGTNFDPVTANNIVYFGAVKATVTAATSTSLTVTVPIGATYQPITVTTYSLTAYSNKPFVVTFPNNGAGFSTASFAPKMDFPTGNFPAQPVLSDFDGDAWPDLALVNASSSTLSILRNTGSTSTIGFATRIDIPTTNGPQSLAVGDLDGDGKRDIAVVNGNTLSIYKNISNSGTVSFASKMDFATNFPRHGINAASRVTINDFDGDGKPDIAVTVDNFDTISIISVFKNISPAGSIAFASKIDINQPSGPTSIISADLDADFKPELIVANIYRGNINVLRNLSTAGNIVFASNLEFATGYLAFHVAVGDLDGDHKLDLAVENDGANTISVLRNTSTIGNIAFAPKTDLGISKSNAIVMTDLDGDGKVDLAVTHPSSTSTPNTVSIFRNLSNAGSITFSNNVDFPVGADPSDVTAGDLDGDGKPDLVVTNGGSNTLSVLRNQISAVTSSPTPPAITSFSPASGPVGTFVTITGIGFDPTLVNNIVYFGAVRAMVTAASRTSLTVTAPTGAIYAPISVTTNNLTAYSTKPFMPTFSNSCPGFNSNSFSGPISYAAGSDPRNLAAADFDGDGKPDIAVTNIISSTVSVFKNTGVNGTISFAAKSDFITGSGPERVAIGDLDGDGKPDMAIANGISGTVSIFRNTSTAGALSFAAKIDYTTGSASRGVAIGDFNGDGKPDLVVANTNANSISFLKNVSTPGTISFTEKTDYSIGSGPHAIAVGDLDGDNKPDVAIANLVANTVSVFRNISAGGAITFSSRLDMPLPGSNSYGIAIGDLDGDGKADLVTSTLSPGTISVFRNTGSTGTITFNSRIDYSIVNGPLNVAITDMDGDGKPDLAVADFNNKNFTVLRNTSTVGNIALAPEIAYGAGTPSTNIVIVDLDADGKPDVATSAYSINSLTVFKNQVSCSQGCTPPTFKNDATIALDASCGNNDGQISIIPTGGVAPFQYSINGGATYKSGANTGTGFTNLAPGTYKLKIKDAAGCESEIIEKTIRTIYGGPTFTYTTTNASCGSNNGSISIVPTIGTDGYFYSLDAGATYFPGSSVGATFNNLAANTYYLRIKNVAGCESKIVYEAVHSCGSGCTPPTFKNDATIVLDASCGNNNGQISLIPSSGNAPFLYSIDGGITYKRGANTGAGFTNLASGTYKLRIKDAAGCESAVVERTIRTTYGGPAFTYKTTEATCGNRNASITIIPSGGAGSFMYSIDGGITYVEGPSTGYTFSNLPASTYYLRVKNAAGCESAIIYEAVKANFSNCSGATVQANIAALQNAISPDVINTDAINAYPNPTKGPFKLQLKGFISAKAEVSVYNGEGKLVQKRQLNLSGTNTVDFDLTGHGKGVYYIKITTNSGTKTLKVLVQ